jgi:hypothetical protein
MTHLSREELIDSLEHTLPPAREAHVDTCDACRAERASLLQVLGRVKTVDVPEPSPLFWTHFSERVREDIAREPQPAPAAWPAWPAFSAWSWPKFAVAAATVVVGVTVGWAGWRDYHRGQFADTSAAMHGTTRTRESAVLPETASDEDWNLVVSMAEDVTIDDADDSAMAVRPGAADRVMADLSSEQRSELARLLTAEMARPAS